MSVTHVVRHHDGASGTSNAKGSAYEAAFLVITDDVNDQTKTIVDYFQADPTLPYPGRSYSYGPNESDVGSTCQTLAPRKQTGSQKVWLVTASFAPPEADDSQGRDDIGDPTNDPRLYHCEVAISLAEYTRPVETALYIGGMQAAAEGRIGLQPGVTMAPPQNSAGDVYDPPLERQATRQVIRITAHMADYPQNEAREYHRAVNSKAFTPILQLPGGAFWTDTFQVAEMQLLNISGDYNFDILENTPIYWWRNTYELLADYEFGFREQIGDRGMHSSGCAGEPDGKGGTISTLPDGTAPRVALKGADGMPIRKPVPLDGNGRPLVCGGAPVWITWGIYQEKDLSQLSCWFQCGSILPA